MTSLLASTNTTGILLVTLGALAIALSIVAFALRNRARGRKPQVPGALRPGPADAALETPLLNRLQGWGVVLMTFFVIWFPIQWLLEPSRNYAQENELRALAEQNLDLDHHPSFLGAGAYRHFVPAAIGHLISRGEFLSSYTPYQPEVSQGTLQAIYDAKHKTDLEKAVREYIRETVASGAEDAVEDE